MNTPTRTARIALLIDADNSPANKIDLILKLMSAGVPLRFTELFSGAASRAEIVVTFLALLELIRLKQIKAAQNEAFGEIELRSA